jgi:hypothetical protein
MHLSGGGGRKYSAWIFWGRVVGSASSVETIEEGLMARRQFLSRLAALPFFALAASALPPTTSKTLNVMMKSAWGSDDPTRASFPFLHGLALAEAGHNVQIFLLGEAVSLMRKSVADAIVPVGWPPLAGTLEKIVTKKIQVYA